VKHGLWDVSVMFDVVGFQPPSFVMICVRSP
jgi:hypothetical protein